MVPTYSRSLLHTHTCFEEILMTLLSQEIEYCHTRAQLTIPDHLILLPDDQLRRNGDIDFTKVPTGWLTTVNSGGFRSNVTCCFTLSSVIRKLCIESKHHKNKTRQGI